MFKQIYRRIVPKKSSAKQDASRSMEIENFIQKHLFDQEKYQHPLKLNRFEYQSFSQCGEDGIIDEIFRRIGTTNKYFIEFGVENGTECNSTLLLYKGWKGLWIEGNAQSVEHIKAHMSGIISNGTLTVLNNFITAENIESLFTQGGSPAEPDLLSIDIDRNDYYVWKSIVKFKPRVVAIEYNAIFHPDVSFTVPYDGAKTWDKTSNFGASLGLLNTLGEEKGYSLVACNFAGTNAFFVRKDCLGDKFLLPGDAEAHYEPARYYLYKKDGHPRNVIL